MTSVFRIGLLPAGHGDCLWIEYGDPQHPQKVLIDGGTKGTYPAILQRVRDLLPAERHFELLMVTHIDTDHIDGLLELMSKAEIEFSFDDFWFNGWRHLPGSNLEDFGPVQGEKLTTLLDKPVVPWNLKFDKRGVVAPETGPLISRDLPGGMKLTILSPGLEQLADLRPVWEQVCKKHGLDPAHEPAPPVEAPAGFEVMGPPDIETLAATDFEADDSRANGSSIAVLAEFDGRRVLFAGDAYPEVLLTGIQRFEGLGEDEKLRLDAFKLSHHGSKANINQDLLSKVDCTRYLVLTNGAHFKHPDMEAVACVIKFGGLEPELVFNYQTEFNMVWDNHALMDQYGYSVCYPSDNTAGQTIEL